MGGRWKSVLVADGGLVPAAMPRDRSGHFRRSNGLHAVEFSSDLDLDLDLDSSLICDAVG